MIRVRRIEASKFRPKRQPKMATRELPPYRPKALEAAKQHIGTEHVPDFTAKLQAAER